MAKKTKNKAGIQYLFTEEDFQKNLTNYVKRNIADETKRYNIIYGINRNVARHIASGYDGLKPVARRILLVLYTRRNDGFIKLNSVAGDAMGKYHPHGDTAIQKVIGNMGQAWNNNVLYITPDGNFGNEQGDPPAAGRYIKCKISPFAYKCFFEDYIYASLDMKDTYTGRDKEPEYLPSKYPVALVNPQFSSIGYGTAANIAPYNLKEVLEANGYEHYEISNFAKKGYKSKHNFNCWKQHSYLGFGVAAHSYYNDIRYSNTNSLEEYLQNPENKKVEETQEIEDTKKEYMLLGLRTLEGVSISEFKQKFVDNPLYLFKNELNKLTGEGLVEIDLDNIKLTNKGLDLANLVWEEFV